MEDERDGVVRIDDSNWERVVELEDLPEGVKEEDRVWCIVVCVESPSSSHVRGEAVSYREPMLTVSIILT